MSSLYFIVHDNLVHVNLEANNLKIDLALHKNEVHLFIYLFMYLFICLFIYLFICLFIYSLIYLFIYLLIEEGCFPELESGKMRVWSHLQKKYLMDNFIFLCSIIKMSKFLMKNDTA